MPARRKSLRNPNAALLRAWSNRAEHFMKDWTGQRPAKEDTRTLIEIAWTLSYMPKIILARPERCPRGEAAPESFANRFARCYARFPDLTLDLLKLAREHLSKSDTQSRIQRWVSEHAVLRVRGELVVVNELPHSELIKVLKKEFGANSI